MVEIILNVHTKVSFIHLHKYMYVFWAAIFFSKDNTSWYSLLKASHFAEAFPTSWHSHNIEQCYMFELYTK